MLKRFFVIFLSVGLVFFMACSDDDSPTEPDVNEFDVLTAVGDDYFTSYTTASGASPNILVSGPGGLFDLLTDGNSTNDPYLIDYRSATDFASGHITGSVNMSLSSLMDNLGTLPTDRLIINVCYTGQNASFATAVLNMLGYEARNLLYGMCGVTNNPSVLGTDKWPNAIAADEYTLNKVDAGDPPDRTGFPSINTDNSNAADIIQDRFASAASGWSIAFGGDNGLLVNKDNYFIVNYWGYDDYMNIGHIEDAYQFTPKSSLQSNQMLELLPTDQPIAVYCWTGQTSAQVVAYLRMLGYDAKSLLYGVNGFAHNELPGPGGKYSPPAAGAYDVIITQ
jgi:rhodanese-related sulfurtransferase